MILLVHAQLNYGYLTIQIPKIMLKRPQIKKQYTFENNLKKST